MDLVQTHRTKVHSIRKIEAGLRMNDWLACSKIDGNNDEIGYCIWTIRDTKNVSHADLKNRIIFDFRVPS